MHQTTSHSERRLPAAEFVGGPWCGHQYSPLAGQGYPAQLHATSDGELHIYIAKRIGNVVEYHHAGRVLPDGAVIR